MAGRLNWRGLIVAASWAVFLLAWLVIALAISNVFGHHTSLDWELYDRATSRWLAGGGFYQPHQLTGPYVANGDDLATGLGGDVMYPPVALILFVPFHWLPAQLWWAIPMAVMVWGLATFRPSWWAWPLILACLLYEPSFHQWLYGNPVMWAVAFLWLGVRWAGPAVLVLLKPVLFPFALVGANRRRWWVCLAAFVAASLAFGTMNLDYARVVLNARGMGYVWDSIPLMLVPLIAWAASRSPTWRRSGRTRTSTATGSLVSPSSSTYPPA